MPKILYEDTHLLLIEKPVGIPSQEAEEDCVPKRLREQGYATKVVHRLDKPTGGVMTFARTDKAAAKLSALVGQHDQFQKEYLAVVQGIPAEMEGTCVDLLYHDMDYLIPSHRRSILLRLLRLRCFAFLQQLIREHIRLQMLLQPPRLIPTMQIHLFQRKEHLRS